MNSVLANLISFVSKIFLKYVCFTVFLAPTRDETTSVFPLLTELVASILHTTPQSILYMAARVVFSQHQPILDLSHTSKAPEASVLGDTSNSLSYAPDPVACSLPHLPPQQALSRSSLPWLLPLPRVHFPRKSAWHLPSLQLGLCFTATSVEWPSLPTQSPNLCLLIG